MMNISRRTALLGGAAAAALPAFGAAHAAAPPVGKQNAGFYRYKVGDIEVTVVTDGANTFKFADNHVTNKTRDDLNKALEAAHQPKDLMTTPYNPIVVNTSGKLVVIDTGTGEAAYERSKGVTGQFQTNLKAAGIDRNAVDMVVISHFHGDHINGLITPDKKLAYPNAEILVPAGDWKFFMDDGEMSRASGDRMKSVFKGVRDVFDPIGRKVTPYEAGKEIAPGITAVATPGHTPGHTSHIIASGNSKVYVQADVTHVLIGHSIHVNDLKAPEGVEIMDDADTTIAVVSAPKVEAEAPTAEVATTEGEPELIRKTKEEEEGESK